MSGNLEKFNNWNSKQKRIVPSNTGRFHTLVDSERKRAWKAALEWVRNTMDEINEGGSIIEYIKEELGDRK